MPSQVIIRMDKTSASCALDALNRELKSQKEWIKKELPRRKRVSDNRLCVACVHARDQIQKAINKTKK